eukprot:420043-Rhodomonas_salina.2
MSGTDLPRARYGTVLRTCYEMAGAGLHERCGSDPVLCAGDPVRGYLPREAPPARPPDVHGGSAQVPAYAHAVCAVGTDPA